MTLSFAKTDRESQQVCSSLAFRIKSMAIMSNISLQRFGHQMIFLTCGTGMHVFHVRDLSWATWNGLKQKNCTASQLCHQLFGWLLQTDKGQMLQGNGFHCYPICLRLTFRKLGLYIAGIKELYMHRGREWLLQTGCPKQQDNIENFGSHIKHKHWHKVCHYLQPIPVSVHANRDTELKQTNQCRADGDRSLSYMPLTQWELHYIETIYTEIYMWCQYFK